MSIAARTALADIYSAPANAFLQDKLAGGGTLTTQEWQALHGSLDRALRLSPGDPGNLSELGRLYGLRLELADLDAEAITELGGLAGGYYAEALALRPTWPWDSGKSRARHV